jgi:hypothetical protein
MANVTAPDRGSSPLVTSGADRIAPAPLGGAAESLAVPSTTPPGHPLASELTALVPLAGLEPREVLCLGASLVWHLPDRFARALVVAAHTAAIRPARTGGPHLWVRDQGILAGVEGHVVAQGQHVFLARLGLAPPAPEPAVARRLELRGGVPFWLLAVTERRWLGLLGIAARGRAFREDGGVGPTRR